LRKQSLDFTLDSIDIRFDIENVDEKLEGKIIGVDPGLNSCLTLSDSQQTGKDIHGHDLKSICEKLTRKQKGSKAFKRTQEHRTNYINWSINQLNLSEIKEIRYEKMSNFRYGKHTSRVS
jgi:transposase